MKKAKILAMAAIVVHAETGKEFGVRHAIDVQDWLDAGYELKGPEKVKEVKAPEDKEVDPEVKEPKQKTDPVVVEFDDMSDDEFMEAVKDKLYDLPADDAKRVAKIVGVDYTNKKDTMKLVEDKLGEDL